MRIAVGIILILVFAAPILALISFVDEWRTPQFDETSGVLILAFVQAFSSAFFSVFFGTLGALGLIGLARRVSQKTQSAAEALALLPNAAPVILLILATFKFFPWARGLPGVVFVHTLLNTGLVAVAVAQLLRSKISGMAELALVEGASGRRFFLRGVLPTIKADLVALGLFVFALAFTSFAVPLMVGGSRTATLEVLVYQKIRIEGDWGQALGVACLQGFALLALSFVLKKRETQSVSLGRAESTPLLEWTPGLVFAFIPTLIMIAGLLDGAWNGGQQLARLPALRLGLIDWLSGSIVVTTTTGVLVALILLAIAFVEPKGAGRKLLLGFAAPSSVLVGFGLLILWRATGFATPFKIALALALVSVPAFYRLRWDSVLSSIEGQRAIARTLGAAEWLIFRRVVWPQVARPLGWLSGLASFWAWGDFALSSVIAERDVTLAMAAQGLMETYRLEAATVLIWILIACGLVSLTLFAGVGRVLGAKSSS